MNIVIATSRRRTAGSSLPTVISQTENTFYLAAQELTATLTCSATNYVSVKWQISIDNTATWSNVAGATTTSLVLTNQYDDVGRVYRAVFTNAAGSATTALYVALHYSGG